MNRKQKVVTVVALVAFIVTICFAPWDVVSTIYPLSEATSGNLQHTSYRHSQDYAPIWNALAWGQANLQFGMLVLWWMAIGIIYGAILILMKNSSKKAKPTKFTNN